MTLLSIVQRHCQVYGLYAPTAVVGSSDATITQLLAILNELADEMLDESNYQSIRVEKVFNFAVGEDQGSLPTLVGDTGFRYIHQGTFFDRSLRRPIYGPVSDSEWQALKAIPNPGPWYKFRIRGDHLLINPAPSVGSLSQVAFEYASSNLILDADGVTWKKTFSKDGDTTRLPERLFQKGLAYRWKQIKGLNYAPEEQKYYDMLNNFIAKDGVKKQVDLAGSYNPNLKPGIFVPSGNWPLS